MKGGGGNNIDSTQPKSFIMSNSSFFDIKFYLATFYTEINFDKEYINKLLKYDIWFYLQKYNMFVAQMGCAAIGVLAFSIFGPGWLARSTALAAAIAFMIFTRSVHPPAASLPLLFIDGIKLHNLKFWYVLFPGAAGCILLCLIQEMVCYLKDNLKF